MDRLAEGNRRPEANGSTHQMAHTELLLNLGRLSSLACPDRLSAPWMPRPKKKKAAKRRTCARRAHQNDAHLFPEGLGLGAIAALGDTVLQLSDPRLELRDGVLETVDGLLGDGRHLELRRENGDLTKVETISGDEERGEGRNSGLGKRAEEKRGMKEGRIWTGWTEARVNGNRPGGELPRVRGASLEKRPTPLARR